MTPSEAIGRGLDIYRREMRTYIPTVLYAEYGEMWFSEAFLPAFKKNEQKTMLKRIDEEQQSTAQQLDFNNFDRVIAAKGPLFPEAIRTGQHHDRIAEINALRVKFAHDLGEPYRPDAEELLGACIDVLEQCGRMSAGGELRKLVEDVASSETGVRTDELEGSAVDAGSRQDQATRRQGSSDAQGANMTVRQWTWIVLAVAFLGVVVAVATLRIVQPDADSQRQPVVAGVDCEPSSPNVGESILCKPTLADVLDVDVPTAWFWRAPGGSPETSARTEIETTFHSPGRHTVVLNVKFGTDDEGHGTTVWVVEPAVQRSTQGTVPRQQTSPQDDSLTSPTVVGDPLETDLDQQTSLQDDSRSPTAPGEGSPGRQEELGTQSRQALTLQGGSQIIAGRIVMRVMPGRGTSTLWRVEFGFLPETILANAGSHSAAVEANSHLLPTARYLSETVLLERARSGNQNWLRSSLIDIPIRVNDQQTSIAVRVIARWSPTQSGAFRVEFGVLPEWALVAAGGDLQQAATYATLPSFRFLSENGIVAALARAEPQWMSTSVAEVPIQEVSAPEAGEQAPLIADPPLSGFARCGDDAIRVYYFDKAERTRHPLDISGEAASRIFGVSWWSTIGWVSEAGCSVWSIADPYSEGDAEDLAARLDLGGNGD